MILTTTIEIFDGGFMEIKNLITFIHVAELNSFTKTAQLLDYSQSTVSFQIKQLETELGCLLFDRINHTLQLTDKGKELLTYAQKVCRLTEEFHQDWNRDPNVSGHVHIVAPDSMCETMIHDNYADFYHHYPNITLKFSTADTADMFRLLERNEADIMLTLDAHVYHQNFIIAKEREISMHFVAGRDFPLAGKENLSIHEVIKYPFYLTEKGAGYRRVLDDVLARLGIDIRPVLEIGRTDIITAMLENGHAISFLPDFITQRKVREGTLVYLDVTDVPIDIRQQLIYHKNKWISRALDTFINYVSEHEFHRH